MTFPRFTSFADRRFARFAAAVALAAGTATMGSALAESPADKSFQPVHRDPLQTPALEAPLAARTLLLDVTRAGDRLVAVGPYGHVLLSDDDGKNWTQAKVPVSVTITAVDFATPKQGWAVGHQGVVLHTADGGLTWTRQFDGMAAGRQWIELARARLDAAQARLDELGEDDKEGLEDWDAADLAASDAEASIEFGPAQPLLDVWFRNETEGFVVGSYGQIFKTVDGGKTWQLRKESIRNPDNLHFYDISPTPSGSLFLAGERGGVYRSDDGGDSWLKLRAPYADGSYYRTLSFEHDGQEVVLLFGFGGHLFRSADKGASWTAVATHTPKSLNDGAVLADGSIVLVGLNGMLLRSVDGGRSFEPHIDRRRLPFTAITGLSAEKALVLSFAGAEVVAVTHGGERK